MGIVQVPEGRKIFTRMTVYENLEMGAFTIHDKTRIKNNIDKVFSIFPRLAERQRQMGGTLSGGEQQMLAIGRALMADPLLLLMDEPSMGLAPLLVEQIFEVIQNINQEGVSILLVEQNANMALSIADRAYVLETGQVSLSGDAEELLKNPIVKESYLGG
jgi:branched-chain amino acid transport system ATP-binding protein